MKRYITLFAAGLLAVSMLTACGTQSAQSTDSNTEATAETEAQAEDNGGDKEKGGRDFGDMAEVTTIDGSTLVLKLANKDNAQPNGEPSGEAPTGDAGAQAPVEMTFDGEEIQVELTDGMLKTMSAPQGGDKKPDGEQPQDSDKKPDGEQPKDGDKKPDGEQPKDGDKKPDGEQPQDGDKKPDGEQPQGGGNMEDRFEDLDVAELAVGDVVNVVYAEDGTTVKYVVKQNMGNKQ
jgi:hypothetical protein